MVITSVLGSMELLEAVYVLERDQTLRGWNHKAVSKMANGSRIKSDILG